MTVSVSSTLSSAWAFCMEYMKPLLIGAVIFAVLLTVISGLFGGTIERNAMKMFQGMGVNQQMMEDAARRMEAGDEQAMMDLQQKMKDLSAGQFMGMLTAGGAGGAFFVAIIASSLISLIITVVASLYYLLMAVQRQQDPMALLQWTGKYFFPMLGVWIWSFLRSFLWIPFVGIILAIILAPRFALAPYILVAEGKGVTASVAESYRRTRGQWFTVVANMLAAGILVWLALWIIGIPVGGILGNVSPWLSMGVMGVLSQIGTAFITVVMVHLARSLSSAPQPVAV